MAEMIMYFLYGEEKDKLVDINQIESCKYQSQKILEITMRSGDMKTLYGDDAEMLFNILKTRNAL